MEMREDRKDMQKVIVDSSGSEKIYSIFSYETLRKC